MKLHCISDLEYNELVFKLLFQNSQFQSSLSISPAGLPTIGYGFNLQDDRALIPVLDSLGFDVHSQRLKDDALAAEQYYIDLIRSAFKIINSKDTESLNNVIQSILAARLTDKRYPRCHHYKRIARFVYENKDSVKQCLKAIVKNYEKTVDRWLMAFDLELVNQNPQLFARKSQERLVLFSLAYQGVIGIKSNKTPLFPALGNAFLLDSRPLVWYYIRYNAFPNDQKTAELAMQRYYESELFGLYDEGVNGDNITTAQCKEIYSVYHEYKEPIIDHERLYSARIVEANEKFALTSTKTIKNLEQQFAIAYNHIRNTKKVQPLQKPKSSPTAYARAAMPSSAKQQHTGDNVTYLNTAFVG
ncbi:hypothetical protein [Kaarinaea lacus]